MRLVSWNLAHQCREAPIPRDLIAAVKHLSADILCLNEYVHGASRNSLINDLTHIGLTHHLISDRLNNNNQVLIASRFPLERGHLRGPRTKNQAGESNFLHVVLPGQDFEYIGLRAPSYSGSEQSEYWQALVTLSQENFSKRIVFMGDLNTDPSRTRHAPARYLLQLAAEGWQIPEATGEWSFISKQGLGTRIDHAVVSPALQVQEAHYLSTIEDICLAAPNKIGAISDHAPLLLILGDG